MTEQMKKELQTFLNRCLRRIINVRWPETISNEDLLRITNQRPIYEELKRRKWKWIGHTLRKLDGAIEKEALEWNPQGSRRRGRPRGTWRRTVEEELRVTGKTWGEAKALARDRDGWRSFLDAPMIPTEQQDISQVSQIK
jgi:hypothetical protein